MPSPGQRPLFDDPRILGDRRDPLAADLVAQPPDLSPKEPTFLGVELQASGLEGSEDCFEVFDVVVDGGAEDRGVVEEGKRDRGAQPLEDQVDQT